MDADVQFYLERFRKEEDSLSEAHRMRMEWTEKETRHQYNMQALLQLLTDRALEAKERLPEDVVDKAMGLIPAHKVTALKGISGVPESATNEGERRTDGDGNNTLVASAPRNGTSDLNRVEWIAYAVAASGNIGITPPEILAQAEQAGVTMHQNYPYVVLKKLVGKNRVRRKGARYFSAQ